MELQKICNHKIIEKLRQGDILENIAHDNTRFRFGERVVVDKILRLFLQRWPTVYFVDGRTTAYIEDFRKVFS